MTTPQPGQTSTPRKNLETSGGPRRVLRLWRGYRECPMLTYESVNGGWQGNIELTEWNAWVERHDAVTEKLCEDEGCPHHGTPHVCNSSQTVSSDEAAVNTFIVDVKAKLTASRAKGARGWEGCSEEVLIEILLRNVNYGDMQNVACLATTIHLKRAQGAK